MKLHDALKMSIDTSNEICMGYVSDLSDQELMQRPCPGCNHINWQLGHLIVAEHNMMEKEIPGTMPPLPEGFGEKYSKEASTIDDPARFVRKDELMRVFKQQRDGTLAALAKSSEADFDKKTSLDWCPTLGALFSMQGSHWMMHAGQWAVVRRQLGRPPLF